MQSGHCQTVVQLQINNWLPDGKCSNHCTIGDLYGLVCDSQRRSGMGTKPMIVHCRYIIAHMDYIKHHIIY